jgi:hypothetical protein
MHLIYSDHKFENRGGLPSIFLAGPSPRGVGEDHPKDWRDEAIQIYKEINYEGRIFIPKPSSGILESYDVQIEWELHHLNIADVILFWVPRKYPEMKGMTTNVEFGMWVKDPKVIYGRPDWAEQTRYLDHLYKKYLHRNPQTNLRTIVEASKDLVEIFSIAPKVSLPTPHWVSIKDEIPIREGKYLVKTITTHLNKQLRLEAFFEKINNKPIWHVTNQLVTHWLKEF